MAMIGAGRENKIRGFFSSQKLQELNWLFDVKPVDFTPSYSDWGENMLASCLVTDEPSSFFVPQQRASMIDSLEIKNFRCFSKLSVAGLGKVNIIVGDNAAGKTALLEAIFLSQMSSPEIVLRLKAWRGLGSPEVKANRPGYETFWRDLFYRFDQERPIEVAVKGTVENTRSLRIFYKGDESVPIPLEVDASTASDDAAAIVPITFEITDGHGVVHTYRPEMLHGTGLAIRAEKTKQLASLASFYASSATVSPTEAAQQFSELSKQGNSDQIQRIITDVFPRIKNISSETHGTTWTLHCNVVEAKEKLPVGLVSSGVQKLVAILLGIASQRRGMVLIDEIDNGFYYKILPKVWEAIHRVTSEFDVQLFVSTHSQECLRALLPVIHANQDDFHLVRVESKASKHSASVFSGKNLEAALRTETEVR